MVMLPSLSRGLRLALVLALSAGYVSWHGHLHSAFAAPKGGDDEEGDDDDGKDDKDVSDENDDPDDKDQPLVTAGGLFTMATYPVRELFRPLTMTEHIGQFRLGLGTDISAKGAFSTGGLSVEGLYGVADNFTVIGGITDAYNFKQFGVYAGFEGSLVYDLLDIRLAANLHRNALPEFSNFCTPVATGDPDNPKDTSGCKAGAMAALVNLPNGKYHAGGTKFSIDVGFPFRYAIKPEIAIVALQTLISIDFNAVDRDHVLSSQDMGTTPGGTAFTFQRNTPVGNGVKPDLNPSIGLATNPIPELSVVIFGQFRVPDFDTSAGAFQLPVTARVEVSPNQKLDIGLEFTLLNVMPPEGQSPIDNRFLALFVQSRFGK